MIAANRAAVLANPRHDKHHAPTRGPPAKHPGLRTAELAVSRECRHSPSHCALTDSPPLLPCFFVTLLPCFFSCHPSADLLRSRTRRSASSNAVVVSLISPASMSFQTRRSSLDAGESPV